MKPTSITPRKLKVSSPTIRSTPVQTLSNARLRNSPSLANVTPRSLLNTPVQPKTHTLIRTPTRHPATQNIVHQQAPVRNQLINKIPISAAQAVSRKLIQKSVKLLNTPRPNPVIRFLLVEPHLLTYSPPVIHLITQAVIVLVFHS